MDRTDKRIFLIDFVNEVYRACDALDAAVPDGIDTAQSLEDMLDIAERLSCRLVSALVSAQVYETEAKGEKVVEKIGSFFDKLPPFRLKVLPNPGYPVFRYRADDGTVSFEALYFPDTEVCLIAKFSYRDLQMFKTIGDHDTDTRVALGKKACECADLFISSGAER